MPPRRLGGAPRRAPRRRNRRLRRRGGPPRDRGGGVLREGGVRGGVRRRGFVRLRRRRRRCFRWGGSWDGRGLRGGVSPTLTPPRARARRAGWDGDADVERGPSFRAAVGAPGAPIAPGGGRRGTGSAGTRAIQRATATRIAPPSRRPTPASRVRPRGVRGGRAGGPEPRVARGLEKRGGDLRDVEEGVAREEAEDGHEVLVREAVHRGGRAGERGGAGRGGGGAAAGPLAAASAARGAREDASWSRRRAE